MPGDPQKCFLGYKEYLHKVRKDKHIITDIQTCGGTIFRFPKIDQKTLSTEVINSYIVHKTRNLYLRHIEG